MRTAVPRVLAFGLAVFLLAGTAGHTSAGEPTENLVWTQGAVDLTPEGNGHAHITVRLTRAMYTQVKHNFPNPQQFLRDFTSRRTNWEVGPDPTAEYADLESAIHLKITEIGGLHNDGGGRWSLQMGDNLDFVAFVRQDDGRIVAHFYEVGFWANGIMYRGPMRYRLPPGAEKPGFDEKTHLLTYALRREPGEGPAVLKWDLQVKPRLMSALYKVYGLGSDFAAMWVGKCVFRNDGNSTIRQMRVRYRLDGYSEWSPWQRFPELVPGQSVVSNYYPVLKADIASLTSNTPANLLMEWQYQDLAGQKQEDSTGERLVILGKHEFVFSDLTQGESYGTWSESTNNAPFVAAWVSRDDMVVKQFAAWANKNAGGVGASQSDQNTVKVLQAIYELWQTNDFTYQHPPGIVDQSLSFDVHMVQDVKYPRDVIRDRSGTCIDLAICYAALAANVGIRPYLAIIPRHCFPVFQLPSGNVVGVEATGVGGGKRFGTAPFGKMLDLGTKEWVDARKDGRIHMVDLYTLWTNGISNPELPKLPADILEKWKLLHEPANRPQPGPGPGPRPGPQASPFAGTWSGNVSETLQDGSTLTYPVVFQIAQQADGSYLIRQEARAKLPTPQGPANVLMQQEYVGQVQQGMLHMQGRKKLMTLNGQTVQRPLDRGRAGIQNGRLVGQWGNEEDGFTQFQLARK